MATLGCTLPVKVEKTTVAPSVRLRLQLLLAPEEPYKCGTCGKSFRGRTQLSAHITKVHTTATRKKEKRHKCSFCPSRFNKRGRLRRHEEKHGKIVEKKYKYNCQYCRRSFTSVWSKKTHERLHTGEKPHECIQCGDKFRSTGMLKKHVRKEHTKAEQHF